MSLQPLGDRVVAKFADEPDMSPGGVIIPEAAQQKPMRGIVLAVGPGTYSPTGTLIPVDCEPGDEIIFARYGGTLITHEGEELVILRESDVLAKAVLDAVPE